MTRHLRRLVTLQVALSAALAAYACGDESPVTEPLPELRLSARAQAWDATSASLLATGTVDEATIEPARAEALAMAFMRHFGGFHETRLFEEADRVFDLKNLKVSGQTLFAASPATVTGSVARGAFRRAVGPYYLVPLGDAGGIAVIVGVSALADSVEITDEGLKFPIYHGGEFSVAGYSAMSGNGALIAPGEAAAIVRQRLGVGTLDPPALVRRGVEFSPFETVWEFRLPAGATNKTSANRVLVDRRGGLFIRDLSSQEGEFGPFKHRLHLSAKPGRTLRLQPLEAGVVR